MLKVARNLVLTMPYAELSLRLLKERHLYKTVYIQAT